MSSTTVLESEDQLIQRAQNALSQCHWVVGECAAQWTARYARGRTDADFGLLINLSPDQVYQRRRVWEKFSERHEQFPDLKWSHFYTALNWEDAEDCLNWAQETGATVNEMKAWRRSIHGEDLLAEPEDEGLNSGLVAFLSDQPHVVQPPGNDPGGQAAGMSGGPSGAGEWDEARMAAVARGLSPEGDNYAPFHGGVITPPQPDKRPKTDTEPLTPEQLAKRLCGTLERCVKAMSDEFLEEFAELPAKLQKRLSLALTELREKLDQLVVSS